MNNKLVYLASPYSSKLPTEQERRQQMEDRFYEAGRITAGLLSKGYHVYSPIVHCHPLAVRFELPRDWQYWKNHLEVVIPHMDEIWVALMQGWDESTGVTAEIKLADMMMTPVRYVCPTTLTIWNDPNKEKPAHV